MSSARDDRDQLRARLEWLQLLGVDDLSAAAVAPSLRRSTTASPDHPPEGAPPSIHDGAPAPAEQPRLFGTREHRAPEAPDPAAALEQIRETLGDCRRCRLCEARTRIVFGVGNPRAQVMFIGEGPGVDEDRQGEPFVGRAGQLLTKIITAMGLERRDVYIANVVKCRPPENRTPQADEIATCSPFLFQQIEAIAPRVIVSLGTPATQTLLRTRESITRLRGRFREVFGIPVLPTFHPAYLLRNPGAKREVWEDMKQVMAFLKTAE